MINKVHLTGNRKTDKSIYDMKVIPETVSLLFILSYNQFLLQFQYNL